MKNYDSIREELYQYAATLPVIDGHEHFIEETTHVNEKLSFFNYLASYVRCDLISAGADWMRFDAPQNDEETVELFRYVEPYWRVVKNGSYARPVLMSLKKFHDCDDLTEETVVKIGHQLNERNVMGHYDEVFNECKIEKILNQSAFEDKVYADKRFVFCVGHDIKVGEFLERYPDKNYDDLMEYLDKEMADEVAMGAKMRKFFADVFVTQPDESRARADFEQLRKEGKAESTPALDSAVSFERLRLCGKYGIVAAIHTGVWNDINRLAPTLLFPIMDACTDFGTTVDIFHMGIPSIRECAFLGKNYPFVNLNMCWSHIVSEHMVKTSINEWLDLVPVSKIIGFGGDVITLPEQIWGLLHHALQNISDALAQRIVAGRMDMDYAKYVLRLWLYENPKRIYRL